MRVGAEEKEFWGQLLLYTVLKESRDLRKVKESTM
jgi:hypothetical protein